MSVTKYQIVLLVTERDARGRRIGRKIVSRQPAIDDVAYLLDVAERWNALRSGDSEMVVCVENGNPFHPVDRFCGPAPEAAE